MKLFGYWLPNTYYAQCEHSGLNVRVGSLCFGIGFDDYRDRNKWRPSLSVTLGGWVNREGGWRHFRVAAGRHRIGFNFPRLRRAAAR